MLSIYHFYNKLYTNDCSAQKGSLMVVQMWSVSHKNIVKLTVLNGSLLYFMRIKVKYLYNKTFSPRKTPITIFFQLWWLKKNWIKWYLRKYSHMNDVHKKLFIRLLWSSWSNLCDALSEIDVRLSKFNFMKTISKRLSSKCRSYSCHNKCIKNCIKFLLVESWWQNIFNINDASKADDIKVLKNSFLIYLAYHVKPPKRNGKVFWWKVSKDCGKFIIKNVMKNIFISLMPAEEDMNLMRSECWWLRSWIHFIVSNLNFSASWKKENINFPFFCFRKNRHQRRKAIRPRYFHSFWVDIYI